MRRVLVGLAIVTAVLAGIGLAAGTVVDSTGISSRACEVRVEDTLAALDEEQARYASFIAAVAVRRELPARAATIALATAFQESKIRNIDYGDRDSLGLFQQRPSQGWGTQSQVRDPEHATNRFYDALVEVEDYRAMEITDAAQTVQRSAFPAAYASHEPYARALASAFTGHSPGTVACRAGEPGAGEPATVIEDVEAAFGGLHARVNGRMVTFRAADSRRAWAVAHYAAANAARLGITMVEAQRRSWSGGDAWDEESQISGSMVRLRLD